MPEPSELELRNIGIVAHINAGKTTLTERVLFHSGKQRFLGHVDEGTATMDFLAEEQRRGISISAAVTTVRWREFVLNLVDMPGHVDFTAEVERCLRVLDGVIVLIDGVRGVESQTEMVWRQAAARGIPRLAFVNKMDRPGADFDHAVATIRERLGGRPLPIALPIRQRDALVGAVDLIGERFIAWQDGATGEFGDHGERAALVEACADYDESILADYVEGRPVQGDRLRAALRAGVLAGDLVPVLGGAALHNLGVAALLDAVCAYLPAPSDLPAVASLDDGALRHPKTDEPFCGLVFKAHRDEDGVVYFVRVYSGRAVAGDRVGATRVSEPFSVVGLWRMHADHREPIGVATAGDIVALEVDVALRTGDPLFAPGHPVRLETTRFPDPVLTVTVEPPTEAGLATLEAAARLLVQDDPTLRLETDAETGQLLAAGMGELHLEVFGSRLRRRAGEVRLGRPRVAFRETVTRSATGAAECRAAGGRARVELSIERLDGVDPARVTDRGTGPRPARAMLCDALAQRARSGLANPYPAVGVELCLGDIDSDVGDPEASEVLLLDALDVACRKAVAAAGPVVLEPTVDFEVFAPMDTLSGVLADLAGRRARIDHVEPGVEQARVRGNVCLSEVLGYSTRLRSLTRGLGTAQLLPAGLVPRERPRKSDASAQKGHGSLDPGGAAQ